MNFWRDERAVSEQVGFILLLGILILFMSIWQAQVIPAENRGAEVNHYTEVQEDLLELRAAHINSVGSATQRSATVQMGVAYPPRIFFVSAPSPQGSLYAETVSDGTITADAFDVSTVCGYDTPDTTTKSIKLTTEYNYLSESELPPYRYENSLLYREAANGNVLTANKQTLVQNSTATDATLKLYPIAGNYSESGQNAAAIDFFGAGTNESSASGRINVTVPTDLTADQWAQLLSEQPKFNDASDAGPGRVRLDLGDAGTDWSIRCAPVGTEETPDVTISNPVGGGGTTDDRTEDDGPIVGDPDMAFDDANNNNQLDGDETTYEPSDLYTFTDDSANLVIPESVGDVERSNQINIRANSITSEADITSTNNQVVLTATGGDLTAASSTITARNNVDMTSSGDVSLDGSTIESQNTQVTINTDDGEVSATGVTINARNNVDLRSTEGVSVDDAVIDSQNTQVTIVTDGELTATGSEITARNNIVLRSTTASDVSVDNADIESERSQVTIDTLGELSATDSAITSRSNIYLESTGDMSLTGTTIDSEQGQITIETDGVLTATASSISARSNIVFLSGGDMFFDNADIDSQTGRITADLGGNFVLHINGTTVNDNDDIIEYNPPGATEDPDRPIAQ